MLKKYHHWVKSAEGIFSNPTLQLGAMRAILASNAINLIAADFSGRLTNFANIQVA